MWCTAGRKALHPRFLQGNTKERDHMEYLGTDVKRLKWILQKQDGGCGPVIYLKIQTSTMLS
jgi:hypothetical protein